MASRPTLTANLIFNYLRVFLQLAFPLATFPYVSRILEPSGLGSLDFARAITTYAIILASIGLGRYGTREIARVRERPTEKFQVASELFSIGLVQSVVVTLVFIPLVLSVPQFQPVVILVLIFLPQVLLAGIGMEWYVQGSEQFRFATQRYLVIQVVSLVGLFTLVHQKSDLYVYAGLMTAVNAAPAVINLIRFFQEHGRMPRLTWKFGSHWRGLLVFGSTAVIVTTYTSFDTVILGLSSTTTQVGYYSVGTKVAKIFATILSSGAAVFLARSTSFDPVGDRSKVEKLFGKALHSTLLLGLPLSVGIFLCRSEMVLLLAGTDYLPSIEVVAWSSWVVLLIGLNSSVATSYLYPMGRERLTLVGTLVAAIISVFGNLLMAPLWGAKGTALVMFLAELSTFLLYGLCLRKPLVHLAVAQQFFKPVVAVLVMGAAVWAISCIPGPRFLIAAAEVAGGALVYGVLLLILKDKLLLFVFQKARFRKGSGQGTPAVTTAPNSDPPEAML